MASEVDEVNVLQATMLAMKRAVEGLNVDHYDRVLVDGNRCPDLVKCTAIIKGDLSEPVISAASIVAKVWRDRQMCELSKKYPMYHLDKHKGYGTKLHLEALESFGIIDGQHRTTFKPVKKILDKL